MRLCDEQHQRNLGDMRPEKESLNTFPLVELKSVCSDQIIAGSSVQPNISVEPLLCLKDFVEWTSLSVWRPTDSSPKSHWCSQLVVKLSHIWLSGEASTWWFLLHGPHGPQGCIFWTPPQHILTTDSCPTKMNAKKCISWGSLSPSPSTTPPSFCPVRCLEVSFGNGQFGFFLEWLSVHWMPKPQVALFWGRGYCCLYCCYELWFSCLFLMCLSGKEMIVSTDCVLLPGSHN